MDIFGFFDQNTAAGDESKQFLNSVFVHNPCSTRAAKLPSMATVSSPALLPPTSMKPTRPNHGGSRPAYSVPASAVPATSAACRRRLSSRRSKQLRLFGGLPGNYRAYVWNRRQVVEARRDGTARHTGIDFPPTSVGDGINLFARYGKLLRGQHSFDHALTGGAELSGSYWGVVPTPSGSRAPGCNPAAITAVWAAVAT